MAYWAYVADISIHAPRVGSDYGYDYNVDSGKIFQSTLPVWGATWTDKDGDGFEPSISIHAPRVGSDRTGRRTMPEAPTISIHAPRVGSDWSEWMTNEQTSFISIHAPRVGSDGLFNQ